jgi:hypothetical protein
MGGSILGQRRGLKDARIGGVTGRQAEQRAQLLQRAALVDLLRSHEWQEGEDFFENGGRLHQKKPTSANYEYLNYEANLALRLVAPVVQWVTVVETWCRVVKAYSVCCRRSDVSVV